MQYTKEQQTQFIKDVSTYTAKEMAVTRCLSLNQIYKMARKLRVKFPKNNKPTAERKNKSRMWMFPKELHIHEQIIHAVNRRKKNKGFPSKNKDTIEMEDLRPFPFHCPVFGIELSYDKNDYLLPNYATLDRVDNTKPYDKGNVVICSRRANNLKKDATIEELVKLANFYSSLNTQ